MDDKPTGFTKDFEHRQALFDAALDEFVDKGYDQASINAILKTAGMSKGQFYYHFKNKEGLYLSLIGVLIDKKREYLAVVIQPDDFDQNIFGILKTQIRYGVAFAQEYPAIQRFSASFVREKGNAIYDRALETYNFENNSWIDQLVAKAHQRGEFRDDLPLSFVRHMIGYFLTHAADIVDLDNVETWESEMNHLITFLHSGLAPKKTE